MSKPANHHRVSVAALIFLCATTASAQWQILPTPTTADLRGIHALPNGIAWASGTDGTVLRTTDDGTTWQRCPTPPTAEKLDFRGIQAFDANTAIVMSSGKGDLSRLYKTTDACQTWTLVFTNPDPEGFWDALWIGRSVRPIAVPDSADWIEWADQAAIVLGDPVRGKFTLWGFNANGKNSHSTPHEWAHRPQARTKASAFAASNSALFRGTCAVWIATGGESGSQILEHIGGFNTFDHPVDKFRAVSVPVGHRTASSGIFSFLLLPDAPLTGFRPCDKAGVAVGGDYLKPNDATATAAFSIDGGRNWSSSTTPPHGYRSSVAYEPTTKTWITVGPNGTDISTDDGRNWRPLKPTPTDPPDADQHWNALSLPYVVGPHGRIGKLHPTALTPVKP